MSEVLDDMRSSLDSVKSGLSEDLNMSENTNIGYNNPNSQKRGSIIFTQNNYSPKALSRLEIYRQSQNAMMLLQGT